MTKIQILIPPENGFNEHHSVKNYQSINGDGESLSPKASKRSRTLSISTWPNPHPIAKKLGVFPLAVLTFYAG